MLRQKYVAGTYCHPICSDNYIFTDFMTKFQLKKENF